MNAPPSAGPADEPAPAKAGGYRDRDLDTRLGRLNLRIPKLRQGSYGAVLLEINDDWVIQSRYMQIEGMAELAAMPDKNDVIAIPPKAA